MVSAAITGLAAEARIARRAGFAAHASGGIAVQTFAAAESYLAQGVHTLLSFGIAGALAPHLLPGTLLLPRAVVEEGGTRRMVDAGWRARLADALAAAGLHAEPGDLLGADEAAASRARKAALFAATGAVAIDLESHIVARSAAHAGGSFIVLRAVADPAERDLPRAALEGLDPTGMPAIGRVFHSVLRHPGQILPLIRLAGDTRRALLALRSALEQRPSPSAAPSGSVAR
jgi:hopanoid-associated phosphorylase